MRRSSWRSTRSYPWDIRQCEDDPQLQLATFWQLREDLLRWAVYLVQDHGHADQQESAVKDKSHLTALPGRRRSTTTQFFTSCLVVKPLHRSSTSSNFSKKESRLINHMSWKWFICSRSKRTTSTSKLSSSDDIMRCMTRRSFRLWNRPYRSWTSQRREKKKQIVWQKIAVALTEGKIQFALLTFILQHGRKRSIECRTVVLLILRHDREGLSSRYAWGLWRNVYRLTID